MTVHEKVINSLALKLAQEIVNAETAKVIYEERIEELEKQEEKQNELESIEP